MWKSISVVLLLGAVVGGLLTVGCNQAGREAGATPTTPVPKPSLPQTSAPAAEKTEPDLHLFVPCGMIIPFNALKKEFEKERGVKVKITYDNGVVLVRKIRKGQRPDVLITPGITEMEAMKKEGYIDPQDVITFGTFELVVVVPKANKAGITSVQDLADPKVKSVAMADPAENSVGYYAKEALESLGLWEKVKPKLMMHWHAKTAVEYVCSARVDAGVYYRACPFDTAPEKVENQTWKFAGDIPQSAYPKVRIQAGTLKEASHRELAQQFVEYLLTDAAQKLLVEKGIPNYKE